MNRNLAIPYRNNQLALGQALADMSIRERYQWLQTQCVDKFGKEFCRGILPENPVWLPPKDAAVPWYAWLIGGILIGKVIL